MKPTVNSSVIGPSSPPTCVIWAWAMSTAIDDPVSIAAAATKPGVMAA